MPWPKYREPTYPLHLIAETTSGMHPWESIPGEYFSKEDAEEAAVEVARKHNCRVHVNDKKAHRFLEVNPA